LVVVEIDQLAVFGDASAMKGGTTGEHVELAGELTRLESDERALLLTIRSHDVDPTRQHHEEMAMDLARLEQDLAALHASSLAQRPDPRELCARQLGEHLRSALLEQAHGRALWPRIPGP
jgi:hypothetical protein